MFAGVSNVAAVPNPSNCDFVELPATTANVESDKLILINLLPAAVPYNVVLEYCTSAPQLSVIFIIVATV
jgi:hypothetical protein